MRVFFALALDAQTKAYCDAVKDVLKQSVLEAKYTYICNYHLTMRYIGEVTIKELDHLIDHIEKASHSFNEVHIKIGDLGFFKKGIKYIAYIKVLSGLEGLHQLYKKLDQAILEADLVLPSQKYTPHITIARQVVFNPHQNASTHVPYLSKSLKLNTLTLFESTRVHGRLTYNEIARFPLLG